jgi:hypothetical protein
MHKNAECGVGPSMGLKFNVQISTIQTLPRYNTEERLHEEDGTWVIWIKWPIMPYRTSLGDVQTAYWKLPDSVRNTIE